MWSSVALDLTRSRACCFPCSAAPSNKFNVVAGTILGIEARKTMRHDGKQKGVCLPHTRVHNGTSTYFVGVIGLVDCFN